MAPNKNNGGFQPTIRQEMPTRFRCKVGGEWKDLDAFANSQQRLIQRCNGRVNAAHSGMTCREHTSKTRQELRCDLCGLIKSKDQFSKNTLKNDEYRCMRCVAWTETQEPSVTPAPLETGHISAEEEHNGVWEEGFIDSGDFYEVEGLPQIPISGIASLCVDDLNASMQSGVAAEKALSNMLDDSSKRTRSQADTVSVSGESVSSSNILPPHLAERMQARSSAARSISGASSVTGDSRRTENLPPHLRAARVRDGQRGGAQSVSTATTVQKAKRSRHIPFNDWDSTGKQRHGFKSPTVGSSMSSAASTTSMSNITDDPNIIGDWDVPAPPASELETRGNSKWPKSGHARLTQSQIKKQPVLTHIKARHIDPDVEKGRRMNYCDSDDSDYE